MRYKKLLELIQSMQNLCIEYADKHEEIKKLIEDTFGKPLVYERMVEEIKAKDLEKIQKSMDWLAKHVRIANKYKALFISDIKECKKYPLEIIEIISSAYEAILNYITNLLTNAEQEFLGLKNEERFLNLFALLDEIYFPFIDHDNKIDYKRYADNLRKKASAAIKDNNDAEIIQLVEAISEAFLNWKAAREKFAWDIKDKKPEYVWQIGNDGSRYTRYRDEITLHKFVNEYDERIKCMADIIDSIKKNLIVLKISRQTNGFFAENSYYAKHKQEVKTSLFKPPSIISDL